MYLTNAAHYQTLKTTQLQLNFFINCSLCISVWVKVILILSHHLLREYFFTFLCVIVCVCVFEREVCTENLSVAYKILFTKSQSDYLLRLCSCCARRLCSAAFSTLFLCNGFIKQSIMQLSCRSAKYHKAEVLFPPATPLPSGLS